MFGSVLPTKYSKRRKKKTFKYLPTIYVYKWNEMYKSLHWKSKWKGAAFNELNQSRPEESVFTRLERNENREMYVCGNKSSKQWIGSIIYSALSIQTNRLNIHLFHYFIIIVIIFRSCSAFHFVFFFCYFSLFRFSASLLLWYRLDHSWEILADPVLMNRYRISTNVQPHAIE